MADDTPDYVTIVNSVLENTIPVVHGMGVRAVDVGPGHAAAEVGFEGNANHFGVMYAGVLFTVAEVLGGAIGMATFDMARFFPLVKDVRISFHKPATTTITATTSLDDATIERIAADADANGKADFTLDTELTDTAGVIVASTQGIYQLRSHGG